MTVPSEEFYRRRLNETLGLVRHEPGAPDVPYVSALPSKEALLAVRDDAEFVGEAYRFLLGRDPDVDGLNYFCDMVRERGRAVVIRELAQSAEGRQRAALAAEEAAAEAPPDSVPAAAASIAVLRITPELADVATIDGAGAFVTAAYVRTLGRLPDPEGFIHNLHRLHAGDSREAVLFSLASSAEAAAHGVTFTWGGLPWRGPAPEGRLKAAVRQWSRRFAGRATAGVDVAAAALSSLPGAGAPRPLVPIGKDVVATEIDGLIVGIPAEEWRLVAYHVFRGLLEPGMSRRFCDAVRPGMVVVDVGANIGMYTLLAARLVGDAGRVVSFEPTPRMFAILRDNVQINGLLEGGRVDLRRHAVSDGSGMARLAVYPDNNGHNTLFPDDRAATFVDVETTTLDQALAEFEHVDVIKIDAEGAEPAIWNGMTTILAKNRGLRVFLEFAPPHLRCAGQDPSAFLDRIEQAGFAIERLADDSGESTDGSRPSLLSAVSTNLLLKRPGA